MAVLFFRSRLRASDPVPLSNHIELRPVQPRAFPAVPCRRQALSARQACVAAAAAPVRQELTRQTARSPPLLRARGHRSRSPSAAFLRVLPSPRTLPVACISCGSAAMPARLWRSFGGASPSLETSSATLCLARSRAWDAAPSSVDRERPSRADPLPFLFSEMQQRCIKRTATARVGHLLDSRSGPASTLSTEPGRSPLVPVLLRLGGFVRLLPFVFCMDSFFFLAGFQVLKL